MALNRSDTILKYIVEYFVKTAQPVGSQTLIDEYKLPYSSATIRNEMYALEKMGLIEKSHVSSGRAPSAQGYEYYCNKLRDRTVDDQLKNSLQEVLSDKVRSIEEIIKESCEILSHMTSLVTVVTGTNEKCEKLASVQLIQISEKSLTAVFVTDKGYVENKTFIIPDHINSSDLVECMKILNERLSGTPINELVNKMEALKPVLSEYVISHDVLYQALLETFLRFASDRMSLFGRDELFNNPEFQKDTSKLTKVLKLLDDSSIFKRVNNTSGTTLNIGNVNGNEDVSMVTTKVKLGDQGESSITLIGPTRMDYDKALSALEYLTEELSKYFNDNSEDNSDEEGGGGENGQA